MNLDALQEAVDAKLVSVQKHPSEELFIYNYTPRVQYGRLWDDVTVMCRGLILDSEMNVVCRPFGKFFNIEEHSAEEIPVTGFDVFEKMDGSLGILYWNEGVPLIATRGSFISDQAAHACRVLHDKYSHTFEKLDKSATYLFEIIYPENRIVVDYGSMDDLVLLTVIDNESGEERIEDIGFPVVRRFHGVNSLEELRALEEDNKEGFVVRFHNGFRVKMKFAEYVRLHRIVTGVSNIAVWEYLMEGKPFDELLDRVPDEFYAWLKKTESELRGKFNDILNECKSVFKDFGNRKENAIYYQTQKHPSVLFAMLDGKNPDKIIWKMVRPKYSKPFKTEQ